MKIKDEEEDEQLQRIRKGESGLSREGSLKV